MRLELAAHRHRSDARVAVELASVDRGLAIHYELWSCEPILLQPAFGASPGRRDELWRHTCCELFAAARDRSTAQGAVERAYLEFNFSPMGDWAAYAFSAPREGMRTQDLQHPPRVDTQVLAAGRDAMSHGVGVTVHLTTDALEGFSLLWPTVVLETTTGLSYWALRHPGDQPDFHHPENFDAAVGLA